MVGNQPEDRSNDQSTSMGRRKVLRNAALTGVMGSIGSAGVAEIAAADHEVTSNQTLFHDSIPVDVTNVDWEVEHVVSVTIFEGHCEQGEWRHPFDINVNTIVYEEGNPENKIDEGLKSQMVELTFPDDSVHKEEDSPNDSGGFRYNDEGSDFSDTAGSAILYGVGELTPYGWIIGGAQVAENLLTDIVEYYDDTDEIRRDWIHYAPYRDEAGHLVPQGSGWASYVAEYTPGGFMTVDVRHGFTVDTPYEWSNDLWTYRDTTSFMLGSSSYC